MGLEKNQSECSKTLEVWGSLLLERLAPNEFIPKYLAVLVSTEERNIPESVYRNAAPNLKEPSIFYCLQTLVSDHQTVFCSRPVFTIFDTSAVTFLPLSLGVCLICWKWLMALFSWQEGTDFWPYRVHMGPTGFCLLWTDSTAGHLHNTWCSCFLTLILTMFVQLTTGSKILISAMLLQNGCLCLVDH